MQYKKTTSDFNDPVSYKFEELHGCLRDTYIIVFILKPFLHTWTGWNIVITHNSGDIFD